MSTLKSLDYNNGNFQATIDIEGKKHSIRLSADYSKNLSEQIANQAEVEIKNALAESKLITEKKEIEKKLQVEKSEKDRQDKIKAEADRKAKEEAEKKRLTEEAETMRIENETRRQQERAEFERLERERLGLDQPPVTIPQPDGGTPQ